VDSYYGVLLATKQLRVAEQSVETSQSILDRSQARFDSGLVVESDLLTAKVRRATRQQETPASAKTGRSHLKKP
jgi:outer membrane protein TolC